MNNEHNTNKDNFETVWAVIQRLAENTEKLEQAQQNTSLMIKELGKQIGGLHKERGTYTEVILMNSIEDLLVNKFAFDNFYPGFYKKIGQEIIQVDALAYTNSSTNQAILVKVKTKLKIEDIEQLKKQISKIDKFLPELINKKKIGLIIALYADKEIIQEVYNAGFYFASVTNDLVKLEVPKNFVATFF